MAIDTYAKLQAAVGDAANRDDLFDDVTAYAPAAIDGMIKRAIADATTGIQRDLVARGGHKNMEALNDGLTTTAGSEVVALPEDFAGHRAFMLARDPVVVLDFVDPTTLYKQYPGAARGAPVKFTITGARTARLRPAPDGAYPLRLIYYQALTVLSNDAVNWVLLNHPDIYVSRAMWRLSLMLENDGRVPFWKGDYDLQMNDLMGDDRNVRWAGVPTMPSVQVAIA
jgi:hypothetical protein